MKNTIKIIIGCLLSVTLANAAVTISANNFSSTTVGLPALDSSGNPLLTGSRSWSIGSFASTFNFATATAADIKTAFTLFGATSTTFTANGVYNGNRSATLPGGDTTYTGTIYTLIGNASTIAGSTAFAVLASGTLFPTVDAGGNGSATNTTTTTEKIIYGVERAVNTQPSAAFTFTNGVQLISAPVPEASTSLLGALGALVLLRRRRN